MGDAAGELAHRLHLLRLAQGVLGARQLFLGRDLLGDVPPCAIDHPLFGNAHPGDPSVTAVLAAESVREADGGLAPLGQLESGAGGFHVVGVQQLPDGVAGDFRLRPAEHHLPGRVGADEIAFGIEDAQQVGRQLPDQAPVARSLDDLLFELGVELP